MLWNYPALARPDLLDCFAKEGRNVVQDLAPVGRHDDNGKMPSRDVMVLWNSGIRRDEDIKTLALGGAQQVAILQRTPSNMRDRPDIVAGKKVAELDRQTLVYQNAQLRPRT